MKKRTAMRFYIAFLLDAFSLIFCLKLMNKLKFACKFHSVLADQDHSRNEFDFDFYVLGLSIRNFLYDRVGSGKITQVVITILIKTNVNTFLCNYIVGMT